MQLINMFNIIRIPDGTYRMYFIANPKDGIAENEKSQNLYYAESQDGFHYEMKGKLMDQLVEQTVFMVKDKDYPYRMVGSQWIGEKMWERGLFLWKSKDGLEFTDRKMLYDKLHDTQNVMIPRGKRLKLYSRLTQERYRNRRMTVAEFDMEGSRLPIPRSLREISCIIRRPARWTIVTTCFSLLTITRTAVRRIPVASDAMLRTAHSYASSLASSTAGLSLMSIGSWPHRASYSSTVNGILRTIPAHVLTKRVLPAWSASTS
jgi:hypothetical protein